MTSLAWIAAIIGALVGSIATALLGLSRQRREQAAATLVPARTRELMSVLQSGAVVVRRDRRSAFANQLATALGIARIDGKLHAEVADLAEEAWRVDGPVEGEVAINRGVLGVTTYVHVRVAPLGDDLCLALANDQTAARMAEQARRDFAVNVSHELKTPIGALSLLAETVSEGAEDPVMVRKFAKKMRKEARRLTKLIQEIIEISRLQDGEADLDFEPLHLDGVVHEAIEGARLGAEARDVRLVTEIKQRATVAGDRDLLVMALRNLIDNAIQYSDEGSEVAIKADAADGVASVSVIDRGIGIDPKDQERIFERFYRADPARARDTGGTGLGLSIVKHVAIQHGGSVALWSEPGIGSTFTFKLTTREET